MAKEYDDVKKGLECCVGNGNCFECPYHGKKQCVTSLLKDTKQLIETVEKEHDEYARTY